MAVTPDSADRTTYRLDLEYDGTEFGGWQCQPGKRTVQGCLEDAVEVLFQERATVLSAGRTDAGVHATGQVAHVRTLRAREPHEVLFGLNFNLPPDVRVKSARIAPHDFHARHSAKWRGYVYRISAQPIAVGRAYCWHCAFPLDVDLMREAASCLMGNHSFRAFAHEAEKENHYLSDVFRVEWIEREPFLELHIEANRFLHGMVRLIVGTFVEVGRGKSAPSTMAEILASQDVRRTGQKAPPEGLTLVKVGYRSWPDS